MHGRAGGAGLWAAGTRGAGGCGRGRGSMRTARQPIRHNLVRVDSRPQCSRRARGPLPTCAPQAGRAHHTLGWHPLLQVDAALGGRAWPVRGSAAEGTVLVTGGLAGRAAPRRGGRWHRCTGTTLRERSGAQPCSGARRKCMTPPLPHSNTAF